MPRPAPLSAVCLLGLLAGCSAIPAGAPPPARIATAPAAPLPFRLALGTVLVTLAPEERPKEYRAEEVLDAERARGELALWAEAAGVSSSVRVARGTTSAAQLDDAWEHKEDLFLSLELTRFRTEFTGHNGWWVPNILNWIMFMIPAWWVATEEYTLGFTAEVEVRSVDSGRVLHRASLPVEVQGTFDEFDRGWQFFGFIYPNNDADNWRLVAERLLPAALTRLGEGLAGELAGSLHLAMGREQTREQMRKTMALVVGISHYPDAVDLPPLPYAATDARAVAEALTDAAGGTGLEARQVQLLVGSEATRERVLQAVAEMGARAQEGDQVLVYFAGYGTRDAGGAPLVLLSGERERAQLRLTDLAAELARMRGRRLLLLDCGFDGQPRSVQSKAPRAGDPQADARALAEALAGGVMLSTRADAGLLAPEHLGAGLFTWHLVRGLRGAADQDESGAIDAEELFGCARRSTVAESAYFGQSQEPVAAGLGQTRFTLVAPQRRATTPAPE